MLKNILKKLAKSLGLLNNPAYRYVVKLKRNYRLRSFNKKEDKILEICGGNNPLVKNHLNVDILDHPDVDVVTNLHNTLPFQNNEITKIYSIATLEHFTILDISKILKEFHRILKNNGTLEIGVPSLKKIMQYYNTHGCDEMVIRYLHGAQKDEYDVHLCILDFERFRIELEKAGFVNVKELDYNFPFHEKEFMMQISANKK